MNSEHKKIDLRSDTFTLPTEEMLDAIKNAKLGDDQAREDPTVIDLEERSAKLFGKEAGLLTLSGTAGNLLGVLSQTDGRGSEIIVESQSHIVYYEVASVSTLGGVMVRQVPGHNGYFTPEEVIPYIREKNTHFPRTTLISLENTHNRAGGVPFTTSQMDAIGNLAREHAIGFHVDGARIFNASIATNSSVRDLTKSASSITFCLSKGLSCPAGSVLLGNQELIDHARKLRQMIGGSLRQAGVIAAPGLVALNNISRLKEDHDNAKKLAQAINHLKCPFIKASDPKTNIVLVTTSFSGEKFEELLAQHNILAFSTGKFTTRLVTHRMVTKEDIDEALTQIEMISKKVNEKLNENL
ncbi:MAG: threonine aldolase family protein [Candidatus Thorarchaeota archaeon]